MAACPVTNPSSNLRRCPLALTPRRLEANRRNATHSTGPRTPEGKGRVARNAIKHGFFVAHERWTPVQRQDFEQTLDGLRDDLKPQGVGEESCVWTIAHSYVRMASLLRYENIAALEYHQRQDRQLNERIAAADATEAARLRAQRNKLRRAGLWRPTIPGPREARAIIRYSGRLDRNIREAASLLQSLKTLRVGGAFSIGKLQKQTHYSASPNSGPEARRRASAQRFDGLEPGQGPQLAPSRKLENAETNPLRASASSASEAQSRTSHVMYEASENAKTNPLSSTFMGNRHARRMAKALAKRRR